MNTGLIIASAISGVGAVLCFLAMFERQRDKLPLGLWFAFAGVLVGAPCAIAKGADMSRRRDARDAAAAAARGDVVPGVPSLVLDTAPEPAPVVGVVTSEGALGLVEADVPVGGEPAYGDTPFVTDARNAKALKAAVIRDEEVRGMVEAYSKPALKKMADEENATYSWRGSASHIAREILENRDTMNRESGVGEGDVDPEPDVL